MKNTKAFLSGFVFIVSFALASEVFAGPFLMRGDAYGHSGQDMWFLSESEVCDHAESHVQPGRTTEPCQISGIDYRSVTVDGKTYTNRRYVRFVIPVVGTTNPTVYAYDFAGVQEPPMPPSCGTDTISGGSINGGWGTGIYNVNGCAYTCGTNYSLLDVNTSMYDAQQCTGTGQEYTTSEPSDYSTPPELCTIREADGSCLDMDKQEGGACPAGTTYGRVNDKEVCVPSGTPTEPLDEGSQGIPDAGGDMQAEGTPDRAGTGGTSTGTSTSTTTGTSTTTNNGDGTSTTTSSETTESEAPKTFGGHGDPASWWESNYPEGAAGIASKFSEDVGNGPFMSMLDPLKSLPDSGSEPSWTMDFDFGAMGNYGSVSVELPSGVWAFIRFCILFTTVMTVRKLIFGG